MSKELIVSLNGREKKIAIIENGQTTEFYIERGEGEQGIVGNIYKGRVMRVLPGMQSAFVDVGLERDAFLYVSDFFDEEEEFERIVVDKTKAGGVDAEAATRAAAERIETARLERERQMEVAQERAEPDAEAGSASADGEEDADDDEPAITRAPQPKRMDDDAVVAVGESRATEEAREEEGGRRRGKGRGDRRPDRKRDTENAERATPATAGGGDDAGRGRPTTRPTPAERSRGVERVSREEIDTPFVAATGSFERVVDEEAAAEEGSMFKDARVQERLLDQIRGVEFDMEETTTAAEVGSVFQGGVSSGDSSFERIDDGGGDDDAGGAGRKRGARSVQKTVAASVARLTAELDEDSSSPVANTAQSFERVSDDESAVEAVVASPDTTVAKAGRSASRGGGGKATTTKGRAKGAGGKADDDATGDAEAAEEAGATKGKASKKSTTGARAASATKGSTKKSAAKSAEGKSKSTTKSRTRGSKPTATADENPSGDAATTTDAEASVTGSRSRGEFARRGGRRRRRPGGEGKPGEDGVAEDGSTSGGTEERSNGNGHDAEIVNEVEEAAPVVAVSAPTAAEVAPSSEPPVAPAARSGRGRNTRERGGNDGEERSSSGGGRDRSSSGSGDRGGRERSSSSSGGGDGAERGGRERGGSDRGGSDRGGDRGGGGGRERSGGGSGGGERSGGGDRGGSGGRRERHQPMITDLLREGQEILVQIAKEPIAQKGARITSHIALPGRFLVYMPTIEHTGVSRKIESDAERVRLRKLIQAITKEEDVPSGGFIVRTAGVGITEQDLRDDARYLIRTWRDIRRDAEKAKAPNAVHQDLDLVQRILRDQLSDDFTAIRVDSEEEYLAVVEFVNRIQPRLVNRVKLYTREQPILEAYGVQAEIEKAIKPRVWLKSGGYLVINQTEALVAIDVNTGKFVGRGGSRLEDTITRTNLEAAEEIARQIRLRDLGGIIVLDLIDMEDRRNRQRVMTVLQDALRNDKSPTKVLSFNDFGLVIMTRKRVKQSLERTLCSPCPYCQGGGLVKSPQTVCYEILEEARSLARGFKGERVKQTTLRLHPEVERALRTTERDVLREIEDYLGAVDVTSAGHVHQEQFDFAFI